MKYAIILCLVLNIFYEATFSSILHCGIMTLPKLEL